MQAVEAIVYFDLRTRKNSEGQTPRELFLEKHKGLSKDAKEWTKDTSNSCMVVATLVATVAFAAMITVPGGNDSETGMPDLARKRLFAAFSIADALSMGRGAGAVVRQPLINFSWPRCGGPIINGQNQIEQNGDECRGLLLQYKLNF
ncbi:ankyrin repeat-containing protein NPR4-like [Coffea eugenioides]|uniref:ankyrin repeat-containing protein NPR4-like n=1 Tax=Coffea eugenioides TaxID=49369 RepID=UPI000F615148|nr:ankyrin repeat-containing protein NPR4-like [Coffea eugenioides]